MSKSFTPYQVQPAHAFWRNSVSSVAPEDIDPVVGFPISIGFGTRIATAGSCFAQHIARRLSERGYNYLVTEPPHPLMSSATAREYNYGTFSARYGNVYTSRQLRQLAERAYGEFEPIEQAWLDPARNCWIDPFRPNIQPQGFSSERELSLDREQHMAAVRRLMETLDVFVFTLGLTECWIHKEDGAAYPLCPGVAGGTFDAQFHELKNLTVTEVVDDLRAFLSRLRAVNPRSKVILTVSPVPLIATGGPSHVLTATTYSKAVLRVAAETICREFSDTAYFPSFEIITSCATRGRYFADDLRDVTEAGVDHVMRLFFRHATGDTEQQTAATSPPAKPVPVPHVLDAAQRVVETICDEVLIEANVEQP